MKIRVAVSAMASYREVVDVSDEECDGDEALAIEIAISRVERSGKYKSWASGKGEPEWEGTERIDDGEDASK